VYAAITLRVEVEVTQPELVRAVARDAVNGLEVDEEWRHAQRAAIDSDLAVALRWAADPSRADPRSIPGTDLRLAVSQAGLLTDVPRPINPATRPGGVPDFYPLSHRLLPEAAWATPPALAALWFEVSWWAEAWQRSLAEIGDEDAEGTVWGELPPITWAWGSTWRGRFVTAVRHLLRNLEAGDLSPARTPAQAHTLGVAIGSAEAELTASLLLVEQERISSRLLSFVRSVGDAPEPWVWTAMTGNLIGVLSEPAMQTAWFTDGNQQVHLLDTGGGIRR